MTDAREKSAKILDDYAKTLDKAYEEHTEDARKRAKMQEEAETEKLGRERNKKLSIGHTSKEGYGGEIKVSVGITLDGTVSGIELLSIREPAGLGMNAQEPEFKEQFQDVNTDHFEVVKGDGGKEGKIDALSGATITTDAVTNAVNAAVAYYQGAMEGGSVNE